MEIIRFINTPVPSNTYLLCVNNECIIIDPGTRGEDELLTFLEFKAIIPRCIILTHDHFDHTWGVNDILNRYQECELICSERCAERLKVPQNYFNLLYFSDSTFFNVPYGDMLISQDCQIFRLNMEIRVLQTPGHSDSSICVIVEHNLFSGDTLLLGCKPVLKKRHGASEKDLLDSFDKLLKLPLDMMVWPGHGDKFLLREWKYWIKELYPNLPD